ncbi:hypothetical protein KUTeg_011814 [Tegillarca granosa]|uniref:Uncharacterized protein n=1 Tax=Tegillarca granosa TaxID=220873 RepID=A0ABQ9EXQ6_TEGGR|nr:hypothetical protein KUTeg_011814 [Tegillarca granosa]
MSAADVAKTKKIAIYRVRVENAIAINKKIGLLVLHLVYISGSGDQKISLLVTMTVQMDTESSG